MTEEEYNDLCKFCDDIIFENQTPDRVAISWLHVIREHPTFLNQYKDVLFYKNKFNAYLKNIYFFFKYIFFFIVNIRFFKKKIRYNYLDKVDIIFVSHLLSSSEATGDDFYFGNLSKIIKSKNISSYTTQIEHSSQKNKILSQENILIKNKLNLLRELFILKRLIIQFYQIIKIKPSKNKFKNRIFTIRAAIEALSPSSFSSLRIAEQLKEIAYRTNPSVIIFTHEGHAWERVVMAKVREINKDIKCVGYQHAALFRKQYAISRPLSSIFNPEHILTCGQVSRKKLLSNPFFINTTISTLGSNKKTSSENFLTKSRSNIKNLKKVCLVLPEGIDTEVLILFNFAIKCAAENKNIYYIFRVHPIIDFKKLIECNSNLKNLPNNIILSKKSLKDDIDRSTHALYRGSTAIVQSILNGLKPIYLELKNEMTINPLYEIAKVITSVTTIEDLIIAINIDTMDGIDNLNVLKKYCNLFYEKFNTDEIYKLLDN